MLQYVPFEKKWIGESGIEEIATAHPGNLVGVYFRLYLNGFFHPRFFWMYISDIGAAKEYLLYEVPLELFTLGTPDTGPLYTNWIKPVFIPLQHIVEDNHKLIFEASIHPGTLVSQLNIKGVFIYEY